MRLLLGISGSIAAYKSLLLARDLHKRGWELRVILTGNALRFVSPLSFRELVGDVYTDEDFFKGNTHINLARWPDFFLIAPATYNVIGKVASGIADDLLTATASAYGWPLIFAPAMHTEMWENPILAENISRLKRYGHVFLPVGKGELASGDYGEGRMSEPEDIVRWFLEVEGMVDFWKGKRVVVTYGGTVEPIDDVRVITNRSSGKMGVALASWLTFAKAHVVAVACGNVPSAPAREFYRVERVSELMDLLSRMDYDYLFMAAAVSDFRAKYRRGKIKKGAGGITLKLERTQDVISTLAQEKRGKIVGFALEEEENLEREALRKLNEKNLDFIVANPLKVIGRDETHVKVFSKDGLLGEFSGNKWEVALKTVRVIASA